MKYSISSDYSFGWLAIILILSVAIAGYFYLYKRNNISFNKALTLFLLRSGILFVLGFLLLQPVIKTTKQQNRKPIILFAQDNSKSIKYHPDSTFVQREYPTMVNQLLSKLGTDYTVKPFSFGSTLSDSLEFSFNNDYTDFTPIFNQLNSTYYNLNVGAVIIASDGIFNKGSNPVQNAASCKVPIYTIAMGDTTPKIDIYISKIKYNKSVFKGNKFPVFVNVSALGLGGQQTVIEVKKDGKVIDNQVVNINHQNYFEKFTFLIPAKESGIQEYQVSIKQIKGERLLSNNQQPVFVDVIEHKQQILLIQNGWHPDVAAINRVLSKNPAYEISVKSAQEPIDSIEKYALFILHQLPSAKQNINKVLKYIIANNKPVLYILGQQTSINAFNQLNTGLKISNFKNTYDNTTPLVNSSFNLFKASVDQDIIAQFQPLSVPFANYAVMQSENVWFHQAIGTINTGKPLICFNDDGSQKNAIICGEGIWRWALSEYALTQQHQFFNDIILKTIQYLTLSKKSDRLVVELPMVSEAGQPLLVQARVYNPSFELVTESDMEFNLINEQGNTFPYFFKKGLYDYSLSIDGLLPGKYYYSAKTELGKETLVKKGSFIIGNTQREKLNLVANHKALNQMSEQTGGKMYLSTQFDSIFNNIIENTNISTVSFTIKGIINILDLKLLFIILVALFTTEWLLRKLWGMS